LHGIDAPNSNGELDIDPIQELGVLEPSCLANDDTLWLLTYLTIVKPIEQTSTKHPVLKDAKS
jgi:hypothetical protein